MEIGKNKNGTISLTLPGFVEDLIENDLDFTIKRNEDGQVSLVVHDFYKSGTVRIEPNKYHSDENPSYSAIDRYDNSELIDSFEDLVRLNIRWAGITAYKMGETEEDFGKYLTDRWKNAAIKLDILEEEAVVTHVIKMK